MYNRMGKKYLEDIEHSGPPEIEGFMNLLPPGASILDVGCAGGRDCKVFAKRGFKVTGVDVSDVFLKEAAERIPQGDFHNADLRTLTFPANSFDAIWANAVLLHVPKEEIPLALTNLYRVLKPGGKLHIRVKKGEGSERITEVLKNTGEVSRTFTFFEQEELEKFVTDAGFTLLSSEYLPDDLGRSDVAWIKVWAEK